MASPQLVAELQTQLAGHLSDWQELFDLLTSSAIDVGDYELDTEKAVQSIIPGLIGEIVWKGADTRKLARSLRTSHQNVHFSWSVLLEIYTGGNAAMFLYGSVGTAFLLAAIAILLMIERLEASPWPPGVVEAKLRSHNGELWVTFVAPARFASGTASELVVVPVLGKQAVQFDVCHAALTVQVEPGIPSTSSAEITRKVVDIQPGAGDCHIESVADILDRVWGVTAEVERYPATFLLRAKRANEKADQLREQQQKSVRTVREERERLYRQALSDTKAALSIYKKDPRFAASARSRVESVKHHLEVDIRVRRLDLNAVTMMPQHEMVHVRQGISTSWPAGRDGERQNLAEFWIDRFEVSMHQFSEHMDGRSAHENPEPVQNVSWQDAKKYCERMGLRLPTEAEFEKVATWDEERQQPRRWPWRTDAPPVFNRSWSILLPVQEEIQKDRTPSGIINLVSSVAEWTERVIASTAHPNGAEIVIKGGSYLAHEESEVVPTRVRHESDEPIIDVGFRCASSRMPTNPAILLRVDDMD